MVGHLGSLFDSAVIEKVGSYPGRSESMIVDPGGDAGRAGIQFVVTRSGRRPTTLRMPLVCPGPSHINLNNRKIWPIVGYPRRRFRPRILYESGLEPLVAKIGVLRHNQLESRRISLREARQEGEQSADCLKINIPLLRLIDGSADALAHRGLGLA